MHCFKGAGNGIGTSFPISVSMLQGKTTVFRNDHNFQSSSSFDWMSTWWKVWLISGNNATIELRMLCI
jgi:hypothetical protein